MTMRMSTRRRKLNDVGKTETEAQNILEIEEKRSDEEI